ncbi:MAG: hypothetical protein U5K37_04375 [Natrialbaceae archaeon]|nr:hypothetical protein [Natrialbaceae archaeon]
MAPAAVEEALGDEDVVTAVSLGGEDTLYVTATRTLVYQGDGLLSEEAIDEFAHEADRLTMSAGRRKARITLSYALEGDQSFTVPAKQATEVLHPVLAGVLSGNNVTEAGESVLDTFRFSELTLIVTSDRLVKHVGEAVWDGEYEEYRYADVEGLTFEAGQVATQVVLTVDGRQQRIKAPNEAVEALRRQLEQALCAAHDIDSIEALNQAAEADAGSQVDPASAFESDVDPLSAGTPSQIATTKVRIRRPNRSSRMSPSTGGPDRANRGPRGRNRSTAGDPRGVRVPSRGAAVADRGVITPGRSPCGYRTNRTVPPRPARVG